MTAPLHFQDHMYCICDLEIGKFIQKIHKNKYYCYEKFILLFSVCLYGYCRMLI